ncbi:Replication stress response regulator SDE2 [Sesamum alatum]|uniref:Replication stress response regulator SDE2 n=1 Tax=Sesamum alatum TaxID=300844 RepID=A0AAE2CBC0_9LAMI|nr:Replication stress response regulator SDE2 [Sesamum alatum]
MEVFESDIHQVFVKLLNGRHKIINFTTPSISVSTLKHRIQTLTSIPSHLQLLLHNESRILHDDQTLNIAKSLGNFLSTETLGSSTCNTRFSQNQSCVGFPSSGLSGKSVRFDGSQDLGKFPVVVHLLLRLRGGKGGFGSLLRGAATKAGQKKTNNFDACRDMSGRRLRHVNAEKKLEEWRAEAEERKLEKMAEEYIKKKAKEVVKNGKSNGGDSAEKYVAKYREDSAKCMEEVEKSVRESIKGLASSKRKSSAEGSESDSKRLKIWMGKRKFGDSDSEDDSDEDEGADQISVIIDSGIHSDSSKAEGSSGSITGGKHDDGHLDQGSSGSGSEEEGNVSGESFRPGRSPDVCGDDGTGEGDNTALESLAENTELNGVDVNMPDTSHSAKVEKITQLPCVSCSKEEVPSASEVNKSTTPEPIQEESLSASIVVQDSDKPLNFDEYHSAGELEVLGMERLKSELQVRGLKCGGTLQERAARLFLLKTTPLEMLPKKLFAKK